MSSSIEFHVAAQEPAGVRAKHEHHAGAIAHQAASQASGELRLVIVDVHHHHLEIMDRPAHGCRVKIERRDQAGAATLPVSMTPHALSRAHPDPRISAIELTIPRHRTALAITG